MTEYIFASSEDSNRVNSLSQNYSHIFVTLEYLKAEYDDVQINQKHWREKETCQKEKKQPVIDKYNRKSSRRAETSCGRQEHEAVNVFKPSSVGGAGVRIERWLLFKIPPIQHI